MIEKGVGPSVNDSDRATLLLCMLELTNANEEKTETEVGNKQEGRA
jgi:hypothetical protein